MTLIVRPTRKRAIRTWVEKDDDGVVTGCMTAATPEFDQGNREFFADVQAAEDANPALTEARTNNEAHEAHRLAWSEHDLGKVYLRKRKAAELYRSSNGTVIESILSQEASIRGITVEQQVVLIESKAVATEALETAEIQRITDKLNLP